MVRLALLALASPALASVRYDPETHVAGKSTGCGKSSPYTVGSTTAATATYGGVKYTYRVYVPASYNSNTPMPLVTQHNGWGVSAKQEQSGSGVSDYADQYGYIAVFPQGADDNTHQGGPWYSWNAAGTTESPGPGGATCTNKASTSQYCYTSCGGCSDKPQCWWTTCHDEVTPTGSGTSQVNGYIPSLYDTLESQLCIDTTREFVAGESNGGIMTYQLAVDMASRVAAVVAEFGSFHLGFNELPSTPVPILEFHGIQDTTVPANVSLSGDGYYYTTVDDIYNGNKYASGGWSSVNGCSGSWSHYKTSYDGVSSLYCSAPSCSNGDVVRCSWNGGHNWFANSAKYNGGLVSEFLMKWSKTSHVGYGCIAGEKCDGGNILETEIIGGEEETSHRVTFDDLEQTLQVGNHYGDPSYGCLDDEEILLVGTGRTCGPKIKTSDEEVDAGLPTPACVLGGAAPTENGCPTDAAITATNTTKAWPICLAKGNTTDPYTEGQFHCLLVCPCSGDGDDCGAAAHAHCPGSGICERGELRHRGQGVCTYKIPDESMLI